MIRDLLCVRGIAAKIFEQIVTVAYLIKQLISQENTCVGVSFNKITDLRAQLS